MLAPPRPPSHDELEALIKEARTRQLRRRLLGAAAVAIAAAVALGIYAVLTGGGPGRPVGGSPGAQNGAPPCRASQFSSTAGLNGAVGTIAGTVVLTNMGAGTCSFPAGRPHVEVLWQGRVLPTRETAMEERSERPIRVLGPHARAAIDVDWANWCGNLGHGTASDPTFRLSWPGRLTVDVPNGVSMVPRCNGGGPSVVSVGRAYRNALLR